MRMCLCTDTIIFFVGILLVLLHVCLRVRIYAQTASWNRMCTDLLAFGRNALQRVSRDLSNLLAPQKSDGCSAYDELLKRKFKQRRLDIASATLVTHANVNAVALLLSLARIAASGHQTLSDGQYICLLVSLATSISAYSAPGSTPRIFDLHYACMMIICTSFFLLSFSDLYLLSLCAAYLLRLVLSVATLNTAHMIVWNLASLGASCVFMMNSPVNSQSRDLLTFEIMSTFAIILMSASFERWVASTIRNQTEISKLKLDSSSAIMLLDMLCDVVLELSDKFKMVRDSRAFAALMLKSSGQTLEGESFVSFIQDDLGRQAFQNKLNAGSGQNGKVGVCNATLTDSMRNHINAEIFFVKVEMDVDVYYYLLGIRESRQDPCGIAPPFATLEVATPVPPEHQGAPTVFGRPNFSQTRAPSQAFGGLHNPQLRGISRNARLLSLETCLSSWNVTVKRVVCCSYHAYVMAGKKVLSQLAKAQCDATFPTFATDGLQCQACGILVGNDAEDEYATCPTCESDSLRAYHLEESASAAAGSRVDEGEYQGPRSL
eukprot:TRINITY_DN8948_c0_g2_i1.p1 TRINITY_DN8948_c0_g2~~TRINITY_DN8948_c0_g2_i1.p1  ORF type:complete len:548 (+),score=48.94 TRINITY_DN8948_c0_g2_i1:32-1675(+)